MKVAVHPWQLRGKRVWVVRRMENGKRKCSFFDSRTSADAEASRLRAQLADNGAIWCSLPADERTRLMQAYAESKRLGVDINAALHAAKSQPTNGDGPALSVVIAELVDAKTKSGRAKDYTSNLTLLLGQFAAGRESLPVGKVALACVESFLDGKSLASRSTLRARLSTLFKFAVRRGYRTDNPCARLEAVTYVKPPPQVFTSKQFAKAVRWLTKHAPRGLPWFALSTLCGLRPEEAEKTRRADINFKEGFIRIEAQTTKVRQRRIVYPRVEAMTFLQWAVKRGKLPIPSVTRRRIVRDLRSTLGFKSWPKDITRHTAASYWLADDGSAATVAKMLGNSESILNRDYKALVTRQEAQAFWKLVGRKR